LLAHFEAISRGVLNVADLLYYALFIVCWLAANVVVIEKKKSE
jgi:ABC-2 type transport system permease protein